MAFRIQDQLIGAQPIAATDTVQNHPLGTRLWAEDENYGSGEFIYLAGVALTAIGSLVKFNPDDFSTSLATSGDEGSFAVAMSANVASQYGWYQIKGKAQVKALTGFADNADCYLTATAGSIDDDATIGGDFIHGMLGASALSGGLADVEIDYPYVETEVSTAGDAENGKPLVVGEAGDTTALLDFSSLALAAGARVIRGSGLDFEAVTGWLAFSGNTEQDAFRYSAYFQPQTSASGKILGIGSIPILQSGASVNVAEALQALIQIDAGATITSRGGDATAGIHNIWAKINGTDGATYNTGLRMAPLWLDIQCANAGFSGEEVFMMLASTENAIEAFIKWETSAQCNYFLKTDHGNGTGFLTATGFDEPQSNNVIGFIKVDFNGTPGAIPVMGAT